MLTDGLVPGRAVLEEVALLLGINEAFVEKDWFVTEVINVLVQHPQAGLSLVFTGGTALSKAHKLIKRFSEDVDFRVVGPALTGRSVSAKRSPASGSIWWTCWGERVHFRCCRLIAATEIATSK